MLKHSINHSFIGIEQIAELVSQGAQLELSQEVLDKVSQNRNYLEKKLASKGAAIYGINTGFGSLCNTVIPDNELNDLQVNLVRSHACGTGPTIDEELSKLILLLKVQSLSYGFSGVHTEVIEQLCFLYNNGISPIIHEQGSLGASGDLAPLAHMALALMGEGEVYYKGAKTTAAAALKDAGGSPLQLTSKEGLALLNGTQFMNAHLVHCLNQGYALWNAALEVAAVSAEAYNCRVDAFFDGLNRVRPHEGQKQSATKMRELLKDSGLQAGEKQAVQDPYSFRCIPQVHGATYTTLEHCKSVAETELNAVTDNPVVFEEDDRVISGGNFHGQELALALDFLAIGLSELGNISERRTYLLVSGSRGLPPYLSTKPGTQSGFMIPQYTAASIVSQNKQLCTPASIDSVPSSNGQEDHVSMGANAATKCKRVVDNLWNILAIELMTAAQAWDMRELKKASATSKLVGAYRELVPFLKDDRFLSKDIATTKDFLKKYFS